MVRWENSSDSRFLRYEKDKPHVGHEQDLSTLQRNEAHTSNFLKGINSAISEAVKVKLYQAAIFRIKGIIKPI
jgi:hypothetical protein